MQEEQSLFRSSYYMKKCCTERKDWECINVLHKTVIQQQTPRPNLPVGLCLKCVLRLSYDLPEGWKHDEVRAVPNSSSPEVQSIFVV